ncbi:transcriptional regulator GcvA [Herbaspirillum rhizosphaerae]|uniref:transcriptional regulator GcvA n=1 Tax=Herbaspirillum rhizosphaerae TaxID=346179 RepID=UPI00067BC0FC|nr:transcriptional regulator GcvA [Herbaspirillum rhizosphaerae]
MKYPIYLNALRAFEASARHQSFSAAAAELNVTPAAVGQQVRGLEEWLGAPLFSRSSSGNARLVPTDTAQKALPDIRAGFDRLATGLGLLREGSTSGVLTVTVSPAFAAKWLLPRIEAFQSAYPETDLRLDTNLKALDFLANGIDVGVRYGAGAWPGLTAVKLMEEEIYPVCSAGYLAHHGAMHDPSALVGHTLIHDLSMQNHPGFQTWRSWLDAAGFSGVDSERGLQINNSAAVLQAAVDGHGVALGRSVMVRDDLASGRLVRLFKTVSCASPLAYYVVSRPECASLPRIAAFRDWLLSEAAAMTTAR